MVSSILFGETSELRLKLQELNLVTEDISYMPLSTNDHFILMVDYESEHIDEVYKLILEELENFKLSINEVDRKKKVYISNLIRRFENIDSVTDTMVAQLAEYNKIIDNEYDIINDINIDILNKTLELIKNSPRTIIKLLPKK